MNTYDYGVKCNGRAIIPYKEAYSIIRQTFICYREKGLSRVFEVYA